MIDEELFERQYRRRKWLVLAGLFALVLVSIVILSLSGAGSPQAKSITAGTTPAQRPPPTMADSIVSPTIVEATLPRATVIVETTIDAAASPTEDIPATGAATPTWTRLATQTRIVSQTKTPSPTSQAIEALPTTANVVVDKTATMTVTPTRDRTAVFSTETGDRTPIAEAMPGPDQQEISVETKAEIASVGPGPGAIDGQAGVQQADMAAQPGESTANPDNLPITGIKHDWAMFFVVLGFLSMLLGTGMAALCSYDLMQRPWI